MEEPREAKTLRKIFGTIKVRYFVLILMLLIFIVVFTGIGLSLKYIFSDLRQEIVQQGLAFAREQGISREIYDTVINYANQLIERVMRYILVIVVLITILISVVMDWVSRRLFMLPLEKVGEKARQIANNRSMLGDQLELPLFEELQAMTKAFNKMSAALQQQMDELEARVQERTEALEAAKEKMEHMAKHDALTGLPNRWLFDEQLKQAIKLADRDDRWLTLLIIDLDNYKEINDAHGHLVGDEVIKEVGRRFGDTLRGSDLVSRWGGDEFAVLLYDICGQENVNKVVEKIFSAFAVPIEVEDNSFLIKMSVGAACYPEHGGSMVPLLKHADAALYHAKQNRDHNSLHFYGEMENGT